MFICLFLLQPTLFSSPGVDTDVNLSAEEVVANVGVEQVQPTQDLNASFVRFVYLKPRD